MITHEMSVVRAIAERVVVLEHGRIVVDGRTAEVFARPRADLTRRLIASAHHAPETVPADRLEPVYGPGLHAILRIVARGPAAASPLVGAVAAAAGVEPLVLRAEIDRAGDEPVATLTLALPDASPARLAALRASAGPVFSSLEVIGYARNRDRLPPQTRNGRMFLRARAPCRLWRRTGRCARRWRRPTDAARATHDRRSPGLCIPDVALNLFDCVHVDERTWVTPSVVSSPTTSFPTAAASYPMKRSWMAAWGVDAISAHAGLAHFAQLGRDCINQQGPTLRLGTRKRQPGDRAMVVQERYHSGPVMPAIQ